VDLFDQMQLLQHLLLLLHLENLLLIYKINHILKEEYLDFA
jgi:hypothetical protein